MSMKSLLKPLHDRVMLMVAKGLIRMVDDSGGVQTAQLTLLAGEKRNSAARFQSYGVSSVPLTGARAVVVFPGGNRDHPIIVAAEDPARRPRNLKPGEVIVYDDLGQSVHLTRGGIVITGAGKPITITGTPKVRVETALLEVTGEIVDRCDSSGVSMSGMRSTYDGHNHPGDSGGQTGEVNQKMNS